MLKIGLTGGIGSGKSTVAAEFERLGAAVVDADQVARDVVAPGEPALQAIAHHFGADILLSDGNLDRPKLREEIFKSKESKLWLESLLHPLVRERIVEQLSAAQTPYVLLVSPLLIETRQTELVERVIVVDVDEAAQEARASRRDQCEPELIRRIIGSQITRSQRLAEADYIIDNNGAWEETAGQIKRLHQQLLTSVQRVP